MQGLILDDLRTVEECIVIQEGGEFNAYLHTNWDIVRSYKEFVNYITENSLPDIISLDHDLCMEHYKEGVDKNWTDFDYTKMKIETGLHALEWVLNYFKENNVSCPILIHTHNPYGKLQMESLLNKHI